MDLRSTNTDASAMQIPAKQQQQPTILKHDLPTPSSSPNDYMFPKAGGLIREYMEMWDYQAGARFRGFVAEKKDERAFFVFFDENVMDTDLKPG